MRVWKKLLSGLSVGVCSLALAAIVGGADVDAASLAIGAFTVDYDTQQLTVKDTAEKEIYVAVPTVSSKVDKATQETVTTVTAKTWDIYDMTSTGAIVDLSMLKPAKESYIMVKGYTKSDPVMIHFDASTTGLKLAYDAVNDTVSFTTKTDSLDGKKFQFRSEFGTWADYVATGTTKTSLKEHAQQGTVVYFREKFEDASTKQKKVFTATNNPSSVVGGYTTYSASHFAGAEAKIKITKRANGPAVKVDYANQTFTVPVGSEYRFNHATTWKPVATDEATGKKPVPVELSEVNTTKGILAGILEARVAANPDKNKGFSKYTQVIFNAVTNPVLKTAIADTKAEASNVGTTIVINAAKAEQLTFSYAQNAKTGAYTGVSAENKTEDKTFQIIVSDTYVKAAEVSTLKGEKVLATVKPGTSVAIATNKCQAKYMYVRYMADTKTKDWASNYLFVGKVNVPTVG